MGNLFQFACWFHQNISRAKGILVYPQVLKAGFLLGGSGATGVLLVKDAETVKGAVVAVRKSLNKDYFGKEVSPMQIMVGEMVSNEGSAVLRKDLKRSAQ